MPLFRFYLAFIHSIIQILEKLSAVCSFTFLFLDIEGFADSNPRANGSTTCLREYLNSIEMVGIFYLYTLVDSSSYPEHDKM